MFVFVCRGIYNNIYIHICALKPKRFTNRLRICLKASSSKTCSLYRSDTPHGISCARIRFMMLQAQACKIKGKMMANLRDKLEDDEIVQADISISLRCEGIDSYSERCAGCAVRTGCSPTRSKSSINHCLQKLLRFKGVFQGTPKQLHKVFGRFEKSITTWFQSNH